MSDEIDKEKILRLLQRQQANQNPESSLLEQLLTLQVLNPVRRKSQRMRIAENPPHGVVSERREAVVINEDGGIEEMSEESICIHSLDDGTSVNSRGIARCQTCGGLVKEENLRRCDCGKTCCVIPGCGKSFRTNGKLYCCIWHALLGLLGISLR